MDILDGVNLAKNIFERYSANSRNWKFVVSVSELNGNFFDAIVSNPNEVWQLKIDSIFKPNPLIMGTKVDVDPIKFSNEFDSMPFGYRRLDPIKLNRILMSVDDESENNLINSYLSSVITAVEPEVPKPNNSYAYGPFLFTQKNLKVDEYQKNISEKLTNKLNNKLKSLYSAYG